MSALLALRNFFLRPWRSAFLLFGYSLGVAVMIVLLSIGEALLGQARDERLVGGGEITVLPQGIDVEVMKTGGLGGLFFSIDHARFLYRQVLASPRLASAIDVVAPQIEGKLLYLTPVSGARAELPVMTTGEIPSRTRGVGAMPMLAAGSWLDDSLDRRWRDPTNEELRHEIDHFHLPPASARRDPTWAEWHYFNVLSPDRRQWTFISFIVGGDVPDGSWGGQVLITTHELGGRTRRFSAAAASRTVRFSTTRADLDIGGSTVRVLGDGRYAVHAVATEDAGGARITVDLVVTPAAGAYLPGGAMVGDDFVSGYVVPALRADASGRICVGARCDELSRMQAYHDHNWGVWRGVTWDWGASRAGAYTILYGRVHPEAATAAAQPLFVFLADSLGFLGLFRPRSIEYDDTLRTPRRARMMDIRGDDTVRIDLEVEDATSTDTRRSAGAPGDPLAERRLTRPFFVQMKGTARLSGRVNGRPLSGVGSGFFETYR